MNRAERRRADKEATKSNKSLVLTMKELEAIKAQVRVETATALIPCFALAEHRVHGFGKTRALRTLTCIDDLMSEYISGAKSTSDFVKQCEEELGIRIKYEVGGNL